MRIADDLDGLNRATVEGIAGAQVTEDSPVLAIPLPLVPACRTASGLAAGAMNALRAVLAHVRLRFRRRPIRTRPRFPSPDVLYVFFVLSLERRRILHVNVTAHPHAAWTAQQVVEAVGPDGEVVRLIRDRDSIYGSAFDSRVRNLGIEQLVVAPRSPWQNGYAERFVGTLRRELLDHVIVLGERHLLRLVRQHASYYNEDRPHMALDCDAPMTRAVQPPSGGKVVSLPRRCAARKADNRFDRILRHSLSPRRPDLAEQTFASRAVESLMNPLPPLPSAKSIATPATTDGR